MKLFSTVHQTIVNPLSKATHLYNEVCVNAAKIQAEYGHLNLEQMGMFVSLTASFAPVLSPLLLGAKNNRRKPSCEELISQVEKAIRKNQLGKALMSIFFLKPQTRAELQLGQAFKSLALILNNGA